MPQQLITCLLLCVCVCARFFLHFDLKLTIWCIENCIHFLVPNTSDYCWGIYLFAYAVLPWSLNTFGARSNIFMHPFWIHRSWTEYLHLQSYFSLQNTLKLAKFNITKKNSFSNPNIQNLLVINDITFFHFFWICISHLLELIRCCQLRVFSHGNGWWFVSLVLHWYPLTITCQWSLMSYSGS